MMHIQGETNDHRQAMPRSETSLFREQLTEAKARLVTAVLSSKSCYVQGDNAPLRYRLLTNTALQLAELNQAVAYFDLTALAYEHDLETWVQNSIRLLTIQLNLPMPNGRWWEDRQNRDPIEYFVQFLDERVLQRVKQPILLSFDEADVLLEAPLAEAFFRLLHAIKPVQLSPSNFDALSVVLWGKTAWQNLVEDGRFPTDLLKLIVL
ncbi:hypothetical protein MNBD_CHLOROFLEXI01-2658 [hydrothermal vent metagenome]|uniref:Uncharacterized protein n=1 Tax=hydrothermal vent metagenome TaxID=652676 RepID=A0A3B0VGN3_9ZZZZ